MATSKGKSNAALTARRMASDWSKASARDRHLQAGAAERRPAPRRRPAAPPRRPGRTRARSPARGSGRWPGSRGPGRRRRSSSGSGRPASGRRWSGATAMGTSARPSTAAVPMETWTRAGFSWLASVSLACGMGRRIADHYSPGGREVNPPRFGVFPGFTTATENDRATLEGCPVVLCVAAATGSAEPQARKWMPSGARCGPGPRDRPGRSACARPARYWAGAAAWSIPATT